MNNKNQKKETIDSVEWYKINKSRHEHKCSLVSALLSAVWIEEKERNTESKKTFVTWILLFIHI